MEAERKRDQNSHKDFNDMEWVANMPERHLRGYAQLGEEDEDDNEQDDEEDNDDQSNESDDSSDALVNLDDDFFLGLNSDDENLVQTHKDDSSSSSSDSSDTSDSDDDPVRSKKAAKKSEVQPSQRYELNEVNKGLVKDARETMEKSMRDERDQIDTEREKHKAFAKAGQEAIEAENAWVNADKKLALANSDVRQQKRELTRLLQERKW